MFTPNATSADVPGNSEITVLDQDYSSLGAIPNNIFIGNPFHYPTTATLTYDGGAGAINYRLAGSQIGSMYVGIEPFVNGNLSIDMKVNSDDMSSGAVIRGSTFWIQTYSLWDGGARVYSLYYTSATSLSYSYYDVPGSSLANGVNTINIAISGTTKSLTIYHDGAHTMTTPMYSWSMRNLPYDAVTFPIISFDNERGGSATYVSTLLYGIKETMSGGVVTAIPGNDYVPFGIDYPRIAANQLGTDYMISNGQEGVAWVDLAWLEWQPEQIAYTQSLLNAGWELGIHYTVALNSLSMSEAQALMRNEYNQVTAIFGRAPTSWCSLQNAESINHAIFAYQQLGMVWRNGGSFIPNVGNLDDDGWADFWSKASSRQIVYPSMTHNTDGTISQPWVISLNNFKTWVDNYDGKHIVGYNEYQKRMENQVDTKVNYIDYTPGQHLKFSIVTNGYPSRLMIEFPTSEDVIVLKNGNPLVRGSDYSVAANGRIVLFGASNDQFELTVGGPATVPTVPLGLDAVPADKQVALNWAAPTSDGGSAITGYNIYRGTTAGTETLLTTVGNVLTYTDAGLTNGIAYYYQVSAVNSVGESPRSSEVSATPAAPATVPSAPQSLAATAGNAEVTLTWAAPDSTGGSEITGYNIYRGTSSGSETMLTSVGNLLIYADTDVANGVTYYYRVSAVNAVGEGAQSSEAYATPASAPSAPENLMATPGNGNIVLTWEAPGSDGGSAITGYKVYRGTTAGGETLLATIGNVLAYTDSGVTNGVTYYYKVSAVNAVGEGSRSSEASATPAVSAVAPTSPQSLTAVGENRRVSLNWTAPTSDGGSAITGYNIYRGTVSGGETMLTSVGNVLSYLDASVVNGVTYYYRVSAVNSVGEGPMSNEASAMSSAPKIVVTSPAVGETWYKNSVHTITWIANIDGNVRIELVQGGTVIATIAASTANDGTQNWVVPITVPAGSGYLIKVSAASQPSEFALSPGAIGIPATYLSVTAPDANSVWVSGSKNAVTWTSEGTVPGLRVELLKGGAVVATLTTLTANDGSQSFALPISLVPGSDYAIRLTNTANAAVSDVSDSFTVRAPAMSVTYPSGGEALVLGSKVNIRWTGDLSTLGRVNIDLYQNGARVATIISNTANDGLFTWTVGSSLPTGGGYAIRVSSVSNPQFYDDSVAFSIKLPALTVTSPATGSSYARGATMPIAWSTDPTGIGLIRVELYRNGALVTVIISGTSNDGSHSWRIPTYLTAGQYQLKVSSVSYPAAYAWSGVFNIT